MVITSGKKKHAVEEGAVRVGEYALSTKIREMPRCISPAGIAVYSLPLDKIISSPDLARRSYSAESITALAESIRKYGVISPITVIAREDGMYEVLCGERRVRAARLLLLSKIKAMVITCAEEKREALMLSDNIQSEEMHYLDVAYALKKICEKYSLTVEQLAAKLCVSCVYISQKLKIADGYGQDICEYIKKHGIGEDIIFELLHVDSRDMRERMLRTVSERRLGICEVERMVYLYNKKKSRKGLPPPHTYLIRDVRIFYNSVDRAVAILRRAGYGISAEKNECDDGIEIKIFIHRDR